MSAKNMVTKNVILKVEISKCKQEITISDKDQLHIGVITDKEIVKNKIHLLGLKHNRPRYINGTLWFKDKIIQNTAKYHRYFWNPIKDYKGKWE